MYVVQECVFEQWMMLLKNGRKFRTRTQLIFIPVTCWWLEVDNRDIQLKGSKVCNE